MIDCDVDSLIENLNQLLNFGYPSHISNSPWMLRERDRVELLYKQIVLLRLFLAHSEETRYTVEKVKALVIRIIDVATKVEDMFDSFFATFVVKYTNKGKKKKKKKRTNTNVRSLELENVMQAIRVINRDISDFGNHKIPEVAKYKGSISRVNSFVPKEEKIVGFDIDVREILDRLVAVQKQLDVISIVGMGGLGKTTLAKRAYYDPYVAHHFYIRGWVTICQTYQTKNLLLSICSSLSLTNEEARKMSIGKLREVLFKGLKGKRYLIVIDDIWSLDAWNDIRICFPDDNMGSRVLVTSRLKKVAIYIKPNSPPHLLRFLTMEESWDLLKQKVFAKDDICPVNLQETGKKIAERCRGLPLAILVISGLLAKTEKSVDWWNRVLESIGSYIVSDPEQYMNTLALSYNHLPYHLKSCFLYFGAFQEDFEIDARKLMWLWVAEGFVKSGTEKVAEEYLIDLIERSLLIVEQKRLDGGVKVCRVHDLLHDLCLKKAKEEKFLHEMKALEQVASSPNTTVRRLFNHSHVPDYIFSKSSSPSARSFLFFKMGFACGFTEENLPFLYSAFKHIRVLEFRSVGIRFLPSEIGQLVQLRYLSLRIVECVLPRSISNLRNLQTLIVYGGQPIDFPFIRDSNMTSLMHLCIYPCVRSQYPVSLPKIRTISLLHLPVGRQPVLERAPNLRKLGCIVSVGRRNLVHLPPLDFLIHLEKLKINIDNKYRYGIPNQLRLTYLNRLPHNLRKVTFSNCYLPWEDLSQLGRLPNLEILKLLCGFYQGPRWVTNDGEFQKLKYLEIQSPELAVWKTYNDHFPQLERLVMNSCRRLKKIPMCIGDIPTMGLIELRRPRTSAADTARRILKEQKSLGNDGLKLIIYDHEKDTMWNPSSLLPFKFRLPRMSYSDGSDDEDMYRR